MRNLFKKSVAVGALLLFTTTSNAINITDFTAFSAVDIVGPSINFGSVTVTGGYGSGFETDLSFTTVSITYTDIILDADRPLGGLGVYSGTARDSDNLQGDRGSLSSSNAFDEILFFDFGGLTKVTNFILNGDHTDLVLGTDTFGIWASLNGANFFNVLGNGAPAGGENLFANTGTRYQWWAVSGNGPRDSQGATGAYVASVASVVPEASTIAMLGLGLLGMGFVRRRV